MKKLKFPNLTFRTNGGNITPLGWGVILGAIWGIVSIIRFQEAWDGVVYLLLPIEIAGRLVLFIPGIPSGIRLVSILICSILIGSFLGGLVGLFIAYIMNRRSR